MSKLALLVDITLHPGRKAEFLKRVREHGDRCLDREPGCLSFTVLEPDDGGDTVHLCEVYADQAAIDHHLGTDYMAQYMADTKEMIAHRQRRLCKVV